MVGDKYEVLCEECGRYLFTAEEVPYENGDGFLLGREVRSNDHKDYLYEDGKFICNKCMEVDTCTVMRQNTALHIGK